MSTRLPPVPGRGQGTVTPITTPVTEPPHSIEAEQSCLGGLMLDNSTWPTVNSIVAKADFYRLDHKLIYHAISTLATQGKPFDTVTLGEWLESHQRLDDAGGFAYLALLARDTPSATNVTEYARIIHKKALERHRLAAIAKGDHHQATAITAALDDLEASRQATTPDKGAPTGDKKYCKLFTVDDLLSRPMTHDWLIKGYIERKQTIVLWGESQSFKSILAIAMACSVALGIDWYGHKVKQGAVLYIAGEGGGGGLGRRFKAWQIANQLPLAGLPLIFREAQTLLPDDTHELTEEVTAFLKERGWKLEFIILDTLARTICGDENSQKDFSKYQQALDFIRDKFDCAAMFIHHPGHTDKGRPRGAYSIIGNPDVSLQMELLDKNTTRLVVRKIKDAKELDDMVFKLSVVDLGFQDEDGQQETSVVLRYLPEHQGQCAQGLKGHLLASLRALGDLYRHHRERLAESGISPAQATVGMDEWQAAMRPLVADKSSRSTLRNDLKDMGYVSWGEGSYVYITDRGEEALKL